MDDMSERLGLVSELVTLSRPLEDVLGDLTRQTGDADTELVVLDHSHLASALERYLAGELDASVIEAWADAIELRDDIGVPEDDDVLKDALFSLANPASPLTAQMARELLRRLRA